MTVDDPHLTADAPPLSIHQVWRDLLGGATEAQTVEPDDAPAPTWPHRGTSCGNTPHHSRRYSSLPEPDTLPWPDTYGVTWEDQIGVEIRDLGEQIVPRPLTSGDGDIGKRRVSYRCFECYPAYLASRYHRLPWSFTVSLSAPAGCFQDWWASARILSGFLPPAPARSVAEILGQPFWIGVFATQPRFAWKRVGRDRRLAFDPQGGEPHAHLVVGNVSRESLDQVLARWPEQGRFCVVKPVTHAWSALHYCLSQTRIARQWNGESYARYVNRVKTDHMKKRDALLDSPFDSELALHEAIMKLRQTVKRARPKTPESIALGRRLAGQRFPIWWMPNGAVYRLPAALDQEQRKVVKLAVLLDTLPGGRRNDGRRLAPGRWERGRCPGARDRGGRPSPRCMEDPAREVARISARGN
jgi:hypothetical protein